MLHLILYQPQIPQNTGNIGRLCAYTGTKLHLIRPLGFKIEDKHLRRSGMDYWKELNVEEHEDWDAFLSNENRPRRVWLLTTKSDRCLWNVKFQEGDGLLFGNEGNGAPPCVHEWAGNHRISIPSFNQGLRSLNLATSAGIVTYEALRQIAHSHKWKLSYGLH